MYQVSVGVHLPAAWSQERERIQQRIDQAVEEQTEDLRLALAHERHRAEDLEARLRAAKEHVHLLEARLEERGGGDKQN